MSALFRRSNRRAEESAPPAAGEDLAEGRLSDDGDPWAASSPVVTTGPWDIADAPEVEGRLDLGSLRINGRDAMELRLEVENESGRVTSVTIALAGSLVQIQVFAAPKSSGIWDEIREEIAAGILAQGGSTVERTGPFGPELVARIPVRTQDGRTGTQPARFAGVDGPRWFLRAVFNGPAVSDPQAAEPLEAVVRDLVVVRGGEAMAPRELLALKLPASEGETTIEAEAASSRPPLNPFARGPEITEVR